MNLSKNFKGIIGCIIMLFFCSLSAQESQVSTSTKSNSFENSKRVEKYQQLLKLGYKEKEIFEDLGNANFLVENYEEAIFWYKKLIDTNTSSTPKASYYERYLFALKKIRSTVAESTAEDKDWLAQVKADYQINNGAEENGTFTKKENKYRDFNFQQPGQPVVSKELTMEDLGLKNELVSDIGDQQKFKFAYNAPIAVTDDGRTAYFSKAVYTKQVG